MSKSIFSHTRPSLSWEAVVELNRKLSANSLVGERLIADKLRDSRLDELRCIEADSGFVFFGEKLWLLEQIKSGRDLPYDEWVFEELGGDDFGWKQSPARLECFFGSDLLLYSEATSHRLRFQDPFKIEFFTSQKKGLLKNNWLKQAFHYLFYFSHHISNALDAGLHSQLDDWYRNGYSDEPDSNYLVEIESVAFDFSRGTDRWQIVLGTCYANSCMFCGFVGDEPQGMDLGIEVERSN